ncbi:MAG: hypothetical protein KIT36_22520 [Alphaproteobacteria bacterium]|nr:hypothetical protein [Alphaproteobacteria bacterium]
MKGFRLLGLCADTTRRRLAADAHGGVAILVALAVPVLIGALALAIDTGHWYTVKRQAQQQADSAALGAARALQSGVSTADALRVVAINDAARNGFANSAPNTLTLHWPPVSGAYAGATNAVEVVVQQQIDSFFASIFDRASVTTTVRAVAAMTMTDACVLALSNTAARALQFSGSSTINAPACGFAANSAASDSLYVSGSTGLEAKSLTTSGDVDLGGSLTLNEPTFTHQPHTRDPYSGLGTPSIGSATANNFSLNGSGDQTINPGVYSGGIKMNGSGTLYMNKGTYILDGGDFTMLGNGRIRCGNCTAASDGVTIVLTAKNGNVGTVNISGSGDVELSAPGDASNPYQGVLIYQDKAATQGNAAKFNGGSKMKLSGALYLPQADVTYSGSSSLASGKNCVVIVGYTTGFTGNSSLSQTDCAIMGTKTVDVARTLSLVE